MGKPTRPKASAQPSSSPGGHDVPHLYRELYECAPAGLLCFDSKGVIERANRRAMDLLARNPEDLIGQRIEALVAPGQDQVCLTHMRTAAGDAETASHDIQFQRPDGSTFWARLETLSVEVGQQKIEFRSSLVDVTDRIEAENKRLRLERQLQHDQKAESLEMLAGGLAHDFNNILMTILGSAEAAQEHIPPNAPGLSEIRQIEDAAHRATELTRMVLAYAGGAPSESKPISLSRHATKLEKLLHSVASRKGRLHFELDGEMPHILGDEAQLHQVLLNLVTNAAEALDDPQNGRITIRTGVKHCSGDERLADESGQPLEPGPYAYLQVADNGRGMDAAISREIFEPFFTTKFHGRGLGLAATLGIVRGHGGTIQVDSRPGAGATFTAYFPLAEQALAEPLPIDEPASSMPWCGEGRALIADDEQQVRRITRGMLERMGYTVVTAADGLEAVEAFRSHDGDFAFVLLDLTMPRMNGMEAAREIRRLQPEAKLILTSGYTEHDVRLYTGLSGELNFLQKPYTKSTLIGALQHTLREEHS